MKFLIFILAFSLQVQAVEKCAQYFIAVADLKKLADTTQNQKAFAKALIEEPHADVLVKISKEFGVSIDEIKNDIKAVVPTVEAKTNPEPTYLDWALRKTHEIEPKGGIATIEAQHNGYFLGALSKPTDENYWLNLFDSTGQLLTVHQVTKTLALNNKYKSHKPINYSKDEILSPSGELSLKVEAEQIQIKNLYIGGMQKLKNENVIVSAIWGDLDSRLFTVEHADKEIKVVWSMIGSGTQVGKLVKVQAHSITKLPDELILSPDKNDVLILHKENGRQIKEAYIWNLGEDNLKKIDLSPVPSTSAHFTSRNNIVFLKDYPVGTYSQIFNFEGVAIGEEKQLAIGRVARKISQKGDYAVFFAGNRDISLYHFDTGTTIPLPDHLKEYEVSFSPDYSQKLYLLEAKDKISVWEEGPRQQIKPLKGPK